MRAMLEARKSGGGGKRLDGPLCWSAGNIPEPPWQAVNVKATAAGAIRKESPSKKEAFNPHDPSGVASCLAPLD